MKRKKKNNNVGQEEKRKKKKRLKKKQEEWKRQGIGGEWHACLSPLTPISPFSLLFPHFPFTHTHNTQISHSHFRPFANLFNSTYLNTWA